MRQFPVFASLVLIAGLGSSVAHADTFRVTNGNDRGAGSLRAAIMAANANPVPYQHNIEFDGAGRQVTLTDPLPKITTQIQFAINDQTPTIPIVIRRDPAVGRFTMFEIGAGVSVAMWRLALVGGSSEGNGGLVSNFGSVWLRECTLSDSTAAQGGAIFNGSSGYMTLSNCTLKGNSATTGGAVFNAGEFVAYESTFAGNSAQTGGAVESNISDRQYGGYARFYTCTLTGNTAAERGGAINVVDHTFTLQSCTLVGNTASPGYGMGVHLRDSPAGVTNRIEIGNSIVAGNTPIGGSGGNIDFAMGDQTVDPVISQGYNLVGGTVGWGNLFTSTGDRVGYDESTIKVAALADNGGPTPTVALLPGSPALDAGNTTDLTDQRGAGRSLGGAPDIGAFEGVQGGNSAPVAREANFTWIVGRPFTLPLQASDVDGDSLTYSIVEGKLPAGLILDTNTGELAGAPTEMVKDLTLRFRVSDGQLHSNTAKVVFTIGEVRSAVVNTTGEPNWSDGKTSLNEAIDFVLESGTNIPITFDLPVGDREIVLTQPLTPLTGNMSITGPTTGGGVTIRRSSVQGTPKFSIFRVQGSYVTLRNLTIQSGDAGDGKGGGVSNLNGGLIMERCTLVGNSAQEGGGVYGLMQEYGTYTCLLSCTVTGNVAQQGGGMSVGIGVFVIDSSTIVGNRAAPGAGAGVWALSNHLTNGRVSNSIIAGNLTSGEGSVGNADVVTEALPFERWAFESWGGNVIGDGNAVICFKSARDIVGVTDAELGVEPLAQNGGFTPTMALRSSSPAVNRSRNHEEFDQRNFPRVSGEFADSGAYELLFNDSLKVTSLTLMPEAPRFGSTLQAEAKVASSGEPYRLVYIWTRTREGKTLKLDVTGATLDSSKSDIRQGDVITVTAVASQGLYDSPPASAAVTIANSPITLTGFDLKPRAPYSFETMVATARTTDPDRTKPTYTFTWKKNGVVTRTFTGKSSQDLYNLRTNGFGDKGDVIEVSVVASDGESSASAGGTATIRNSIPVVESLTLSPQAPTPTSTIISTYAGRDADGDKLTRTYKWRIGTKLLKDETGSRLDLKKYSFVKPGDIVSVDLQLFDGEAKSKTLTAKVTVAGPGTSPVLAPAGGSAASS